MADIIHELEQKRIVSAQDAENMHADFDNIQLSIFRDTKKTIQLVHLLAEGIQI